MLNLESTNPALNSDEFNAYAYREGLSEAAVRRDVATAQGVVNKTAILVSIAIVCGGIGYWLVGIHTSVLWISAIAGLLVTLGVYFVIQGKPALSPFLAPVYAVVEGFFLGAFTGAIESSLAMAGVEVVGGVALQAFVITVSILLAMLGLYSARIIKPTRRLKAVVITATVGIMVAYLASFVLSLFGFALPFVSAMSVMETGMAGWIGLGVNLLILCIASLWLIIDFEIVEQHVAAGSTKTMEWYCGFALLVSLAWIYFEAVKLSARLAVLFSGRD